MKTGQYPEFTVPGILYINSKGVVTSIKLLFDKKSFEEIQQVIELRQEMESKGTVNVVNFWQAISQTSTPEKIVKNEVKFNPNLRDSKGRFTSKAKQAQVIQDLKSKGVKWDTLSATKQKEVFKNSQIIQPSASEEISEFDRTTIRNTIAQSFDSNPNFVLEIKGTDTKSRAYLSKESALKAVDQQLNKFYQSAAKVKPSKG